MLPQTAPPASLSHSATSALLWLIVLVVGGAAVGAWYQSRRSVLRAWQRLAEEMGGEFKAKNSVSPERIVGTLHDRPFVLETALSHDDDAPYYHTRGAFPLKNPASFILGVRRKSLLEEAQTRRDRSPYDLEDPDFERQFFVVCNDAQSIADVLAREVRRELGRYHDIEIYARLNEIEWRRAGEVGDLTVIRRLNTLVSDMATAIDNLPKRARTLSERLADEELIAKGV
jgi:hypothetical protein